MSVIAQCCWLAAACGTKMLWAYLDLLRLQFSPILYLYLRRAEVRQQKQAGEAVPHAMTAKVLRW